MAKVCVFSGSKSGLDPVYGQEAASLGRALAKAGHILLCGGASSGLMKTCAEAAHQAGGKVEVVIPTAFYINEPQPDYAHVTEVFDIAARKQLFIKNAQAYVALPGGLGTVEEVFSAATSRQYGEHDAPVILFNINGFWNGMAQQMDTISQERFMPLNPVTVVSSLKGVLKALPKLQTSSSYE